MTNSQPPLPSSPRFLNLQLNGEIFLPAPFGKRLIAFFLDFIFAGSFYKVCDQIQGELAHYTSTSFWDYVILACICWLLYFYCYFVFPIQKFHATFGKIILGLKLVSYPDGKKLGFAQIFFREHVGKFISTLLLMFGFILPLFRADGRSLHDLLFGTIVVQKN